MNDTDYKTVTKDGIKPVIQIAHQRIGGIHLRLFDKKGYVKAIVVWDGETFWIKEGGMKIHVTNIPEVKHDIWS